MEALIRFQANSAEHWKAEDVRHELLRVWPDHENVHESRAIKMEVTQQQGKEPTQSLSSPEVEAYVFRGSAKQTVYQARRDGLIVSWLAPYSTWAIFREAALKAWAEFRQVLAPKELHSVSMRYVNNLQFWAGDFILNEFFTAPPAQPADVSDWRSFGFQHATVYGVPNSPFAVRTIFTRLEGTPEMTSFLLDIEVNLTDSLTAFGRTAEECLEEMHKIKNRAFFSMLTQKAIDRYV